MTRHPRIEHYGLIGDLQTSAHIGPDGSADWLCLPRFDSAAAFARMVGEERHGNWQIAPAAYAETGGDGVLAERRYRGDSLVLETVWRTPAGSVRVTDLMPPREGEPQVIRIVEGLTGEVTMRSAMRPRFVYGRDIPWIHRFDARMVAEAGADALWLDTGLHQVSRGGAVVSAFTVRAGEDHAFALSWCRSHAPAPEVPDPEAALTATLAFWQSWTRQCSYEGPYREAVVRSLITLKAMTYAPSGGIVAAPTTSLPEEIGGGRNWDYRFTWLRDAAVTLGALLGTGYVEEAEAWRRWLLRAVAGDPENLQIMYGITGERDLPERELPWLPGYEGSAPVRVGNGAAGQLQLDVYGNVIETLYLAHQSGVAHCADTAVLHQRLVETLARRWQEPDEGIWEIRGRRRHFVHSKVMAWVAVDRTIRLVEAGALDMDLVALVELRAAIHQEVCKKGYDPVRNTFTQSYGSQELDAATLLIPAVGFLPGDDPRVVGTVDAVRRELGTADGLVCRYPTSGETAGVDGLAGDEGAFVLCNFWLVDALALTDRIDEATALFEHLLSLRSDLGLLAEEYDPVAKRQLGNFPQAFSDVGLVHSACLLARLSDQSGSGGAAIASPASGATPTSRSQASCGV
ncbi:GH15 family glucan-1,4-alpha-glucosidase [Streptomyces sp. KhCrAH-43]|uniref:glycoside hydrolase family 15 protein n=1 Tax=unclassified Streptomyces TaxID=2593676 RepID=UPI00037B2C43|nr:MULTISPECIES: glycoside hydrolase family 15 protein [unclassified Streptomyces]MYS36808.1 glycoside hydrolase family 15 protein [Streptomyces sp. SID4920]MYX69279.1 glycoside hydrolase family 15 protein [Streptomyces sp. SID8373]RAJ62130.1 GH15 family glucan-1,4-alpha-glucosidase [Streptomyces sp. KhCrAH-43]